MKFVLTALNKNFNVKAASIRVRLKTGAWRSGQIFWTKPIRLDRPSPKGPQPSLFLVPQDKHVSVLTIVECDHVHEVYIPFIIDYSGDPTLDEIELRRTDYAENDQIVRIFLKDVDMKNVIYEENLWRSLTTQS